MARYIKANPKVVSYLHLENDRNKLKDGNYILWLQDMMAFGPLPRLADTLQRIGAIALLPHEAREEQYGITTRPLPVATDPEFIIEESEAETETPAGESGDGNGETETPTGGEGTGESETPAEEPGEGTGETETPVETPAEETETPTNGETETPANGDQPGEGETETPTNGETETPGEETEESNEETESIDSGDVGDVEDVLNPNNEEE